MFTYYTAFADNSQRKVRKTMEANIKNLSIHYETFGEGMPLLLLHGYTVDYRLMTGCMEPIFQNVGGYQRIYMDLPGMGMTKAAE